MDKKLAAPATAETAALAPAVTRTTTTTAPARKPAEKPAADKSDASRLALVKKVEVPATGNEVEDAYTSGYRLWDAKLYPEAEAQLKPVVAKWTTNNYESYDHNLLSRAYSAQDTHNPAPHALYNNY